MGKYVLQAALTAVGAMVGAGFASGQEIAGFFSRYGRWSWLGVAAAAAAVWLIARRVMLHPGNGGMPCAWQNRWPGRLWHVIFILLMTAAAGAMLACGGEIAALLLPVHHARVLGTAVTAMLALYMAGRGMEGSAAISGVLVMLLIVTAVSGFLQHERMGVQVYADEPWKCLLSGLCYAGFNLALAVPGMAFAADDMPCKARKRCAWLTALLLGLLLAGGNTLLLRHPALLGEAMPFVRLAMNWGKAGYLMCGTCLYLAVLTTACACCRGLKLLLHAKASRALAAAGVAACAALGFAGVVERIYPVLGAGCMVVMTGALLCEDVKIEKNA